MNDFIKHNSMRSGVSSVVLIVLGILLLLNPDFGSALVSYVVGWALIGLGSLGCIYCVLHWDSAGFGGIILALISIIAGIYLVCHPLMLAKIFGTAAGIYMVFQGISSLSQSQKLKQLGYPGTGNLIFGLVLLLLGLILLIVPLTSSRLIMTLVGLAMIGSGIVSLVLRRRTIEIIESGKSDDSHIIDADE